jgi:hypothetical protein
MYSFDSNKEYCITLHLVGCNYKKNEVRRLELAGHLVRMSDDRTVKKVILGKPDGKKKARRPK